MPTLSGHLFTCCQASRGCHLGSRAQRCGCWPRLQGPEQDAGRSTGVGGHGLPGLRALTVGLLGSRTAGRDGGSRKVGEGGGGSTY